MWVPYEPVLSECERLAQVVDRAGERGEVEDDVDGLVDLDVPDHVVVQERERVVADVFEVLEELVSRLSTQITR